MKLLYVCILSLSLAWFIHLFIWRVSLPKKHTKSLINIFMMVYFIFLIAHTFFTKKLDWILILHFSECYIPSFLAYICFYSAIEEDSPSIGLIKLTKFKGPCSLDDYKQIINNDLLIGSRLEAMVRDGLVEYKEHSYHLTDKGKFWGNVFSKASNFFNFKYAG